MVVGLFVGIWVARYLGPEQFGLLNYVQSFVGLFLAFSTLGLDGIVVRELVKKSDSQENILGSTFILKLQGSLLMIVAVAISIHFTSNDAYTNGLVFIIASGVLFQSFNVIDFFFQSEALNRYVVYANVLSLFVSSVLKIVLIFQNAPLVAFAWVIFFDYLVLALGLIYFFSVSKSLFSWKFSQTTAGNLLKDSWPLIFSGVVLMIQARIDQVMLKEMIGNDAVGYYSVALRLIESAAFVPLILRKSLFPSIISIKSTTDHHYYDRLLNYYRLNFFAFLLVATPIFIWAEPIILILFGSAYSASGILLALMAIRLFFTNMGVAKNAYLTAENKQLYSLVTMIAGTITNISLNLYLIPDYGPKGAIVATIGSFFVTIFVVDLFNKSMHKNLALMVKAIFTFYQLKIR